MALAVLSGHVGGGSAADSDDVGQRFRLKPDADSDPSRTPIPTDPGQGSSSTSVCRPGDRLGVKHDRLGSAFAERFSLQQQAVGVVDEAVQNGVGDGGIAEDSVMPQYLTGESLRSGWSTRTTRCMAAASRSLIVRQAADLG